jgi:hypothetical protein
VNRIDRVGPAVGRRALFGVAATRRIEASAGAGLERFALMARAGEAAARLALALAPHARHLRRAGGPRAQRRGRHRGRGLPA